MNKLLLASTSLTRKKILSNVGIKFINKSPLINEEKEKEKLKRTKKPEKICQSLAKLKSTATSLKYPSYFVDLMKKLESKINCFFVIAVDSSEKEKAIALKNSKLKEEVEAALKESSDNDTEEATAKEVKNEDKGSSEEKITDAKVVNKMKNV